MQVPGLPSCQRQWRFRLSATRSAYVVRTLSHVHPLLGSICDHGCTRNPRQYRERIKHCSDSFRLLYMQQRLRETVLESSIDPEYQAAQHVHKQHEKHAQIQR
jgi:hypothetical protein